MDHPDPDTIYEEGLIFLPKSKLQTDVIKSALSFIYGSSEYATLKTFHVYKEEKYHLGVPRHFFSRSELANLGIPIVDLRPRSFEEIDIHSKITLDYIRPELRIQAEAVAAAEQTEDGIISVACVTGDAIINIHRACKGRKETVERVYQAFYRLRGRRGCAWRTDIPTYVRSHLGDRIGLNQMLDIFQVGERPVFRIELVDGRALKLTSDHKVLTTNGYLSIDEGLQAGSVVVTDSGQVKWGKDVKNFGYGIPTPTEIKSILSAGQEIVYDIVCAHPHHNFAANGIIVHNCGNGKTIIGLHLWTQARVPLIVMADNGAILDQWGKLIRAWISPGDIPIGHVYDGRKEWDQPVVLATIQSMLIQGPKLPKEIRDRFGMVIIDEIHRVSAPKYNRVAPIFSGRRVGLSATARRTDGLEIVYQYHFGPVIYQNLSQPLKARFYFWTPQGSRNLTSDPSFRRRTLLHGELNVQKLWTALADEEKRTHEIAGMIRRFGQGRRALVVSQRKNLLRHLHTLLPGSGVITAETSLPEREKILAGQDVVLGIMSIAKEGLDSPSLSMLVICEPFKDANMFQQVIGRILRDHPMKPDPIVIIVQDDVGAGGGPIYGLCRRLRRTISDWPAAKGGPYTWETLNS